MGRIPKPRLDAIGEWSEIKLEIINKYAAVYSRILTEKGFYHAYIDGFAGAGLHFSESKQTWIEGSPLRALAIEPPFDAYHFVELDPSKVKTLSHLSGQRENAFIYRGDCNEHLTDTIFPDLEYRRYRRALCLLDPYGLQLDWRVVAAAGQTRSIEIFLNFPIMDINRNALRRDKSKVREADKIRMTRFWGSDDWQKIGYEMQETLFGQFEDKITNEQVVEAYVTRLKDVAGFAFVARPLPIRYKGGPTLYYLIFAAHIPVAQDIVNDIFDFYTKRGMN